MKKVLLISGKLRSGKNQFADYIGKEFTLDNYTVKYDLFAKGVKDGCVKDFKTLYTFTNNLLIKLEYIIKDVYGGIDDKILNMLASLITIKDNFYEDKNDLTRILLQLYGTEIFRERVDYNYWITQTIDRIKKSEEDINIITDVRFPNEIDLLRDDKDVDVKVIRIERTLDRCGSENEHESEVALDDYKFFDYIVDNNGTLEALWESSNLIKNEIHNS